MEKILKNTNSWLDNLYNDYQSKQLNPPFKNQQGEYVTELGIPIDMELWNNWKEHQPYRIKNLIETMRKNAMGEK